MKGGRFDEEDVSNFTGAAVSCFWTMECGGCLPIIQTVQNTPVFLGFPVAQLVKNLPTMWESCIWSLGWEDPLEKGKATHSSILAWRIPWTIVHKVARRWTRLSNFHFHGVGRLFTHSSHCSKQYMFCSVDRVTVSKYICLKFKKRKW